MTDESVADGLRRVADGRATRALERLDGAEGEELAPAIHGARKDLKKLRALLRLVRAELGTELFEAENRRYRDAARLLSGSRDAQVKLETLLALRDEAGAGLPAAEIALWESELEAERDAATAPPDGGLSERIGRARETIAAGRAGIAEWPLGDEGWQLVRPGLRRGYRDGRRGMKAVRKRATAERVHDWRKRVKDHWYQLRLVRDAWPEPLEATAGQAHALAELLGDHHDLALLAEDLATRWGVSGKERIEAAIERRQQQLLDGAMAIATRLYAEKPQAFERRLEAYWHGWRER